MGIWSTDNTGVQVSEENSMDSAFKLFPKFILKRFCKKVQQNWTFSHKNTLFQCSKFSNKRVNKFLNKNDAIFKKQNSWNLKQIY